jgi:AGCS family alanine or glycine:cation symporter
MAMIIKYAEVVLSMRYNKRGDGGAALYMKLGLKAPLIAAVFSILILISSIGVGNTVQSSAAAESMRVCFGVPNLVTGTIFSIITLVMICGGRKRIERASSIVIPILTLGYIIVSIAIIGVNYKAIPSVISSIFFEAFTPQSVTGGALGFIFTDAVRLGASRGILSNEAGCGTAAYAHQADCHPAEQGIWGMFEVFIDTILLCTLTAFVVLLTPNVTLDGNGIRIALDAYGSYGEGLRLFIGISTAIYALASVVCWSYYGVSSIKYLGGNKNSRRLYLIAYSIAGIIGSVFTPSLVWEISDLSVTVMAIINTVCVILLWKEIRESTNEYFN